MKARTARYAVRPQLGLRPRQTPRPAEPGRWRVQARPHHQRPQPAPLRRTTAARLRLCRTPRPRAPGFPPAQKWQAALGLRSQAHLAVQAPREPATSAQARGRQTRALICAPEPLPSTAS